MSVIDASPAVFVASRRERLIAAIASGLILVGIGVLLVIGLRPPIPLTPGDTLVAITTAPERISDPTTPAARWQNTSARAARHAAGVTGMRTAATPVMDSRPIMILLPPHILAAARPATGSAPTNGTASTTPGSGTTATGEGLGGGGAGGSGSGGDDQGSGRGIAVHAHQTRGRLSPSDVADGLIAPGGQVAVAVRFTITPDGRATGCRVIRSSGSAQVDAVPCPLLEARYRFRPARDWLGRPTEETVDETHTWFEPER